MRFIKVKGYENARSYCWQSLPTNQRAECLTIMTALVALHLALDVKRPHICLFFPLPDRPFGRVRV